MANSDLAPVKPWWSLSAVVLCGFVLTAGRANAAGPEAVVQLVDGGERPLSGGAPDGKGVSTGGRIVPWNEIDAIVWNRPAVAELDPPALFLSNGDRIRIEPTKVDETALTGTWADVPATKPVTIPLEFLRGAILSMPGKVRRREAVWKRLLDSRMPSDRILLRNGDEIAGELSGFDGKTWRLGAGDANTVRADLALSLSLSADLLVDPPPLKSRLIIRLAEGSSFTAGSVRLAEESARFQTQMFGEIELPLAAVAEIRPLDGRSVYLSDLSALEYRPSAFLTREWPLGRDRSTTGTELIIGSKGYSKGLGVHAPAEIVIPLDGQTKSFMTEVGLAPEGQMGGGAIAEVLVDGQVVRKQALLPSVDQPIALPAIPLSGARQLTLRVQTGPKADILDHVVWGNARLIR